MVAEQHWDYDDWLTHDGICEACGEERPCQLRPAPFNYGDPTGPSRDVCRPCWEKERKHREVWG